MGAFCYVPCTCAPRWCVVGYRHPAVPIPPEAVLIRRVIIEEIIPYDGGPPVHRLVGKRSPPSTKGTAMLDNHDALNGVSTTAYVGRQHQAQALAAAVQEKTRILTRTYQRDNRLLWALAVITTLLLLSGAANLWQGRTGVEQVPYVVLVDHLGNHAPLLKLADQPVTPEQSIIIGTLMTWLEHVRMISSDSVVLGKNWARVEDFTSPAGLETARRLSPGAKAAATARTPGRDQSPTPAARSRNPAPIPPSGKRRPTITMAGCCPRNRGGGRRH